MEFDLVQEVAEFLDQVVVDRRVVGTSWVRECLQRVDDLVGFFEQVRDQGLMVLLDVPRALFAQRAGQVVEADVVAADRCLEVRHEDRGEVVGLDRPVHLGPRRLDDLFVTGSEGVEDLDGFVTGCALDGELDVVEDPVRMGVGDEERTGLARRGDGEVVAVDQSDAFLDRIDPEPCPRDVEERHGRSDVECDTGGRASVAEIAHRALEDQRRAGHGVEDRTVFDDVGEEPIDDVDVDVVERVGVLVHVVVGHRPSCGVGHDPGGRVDRRAQMAPPDAVDRIAGLDRDVIGASRTESDDGDRTSC